MKKNLHEACGYSYFVERIEGKTEPPVVYRGPNAAEHFLQAVQEEEQKIKEVLDNPEPIRTHRTTQ